MDVMPAYQRWLDNARAVGAPLTDYNCPSCAWLITTPVPAKGATYDTLATCPNCTHVHLKIVLDDGTVKLPEVA